MTCCFPKELLVLKNSSSLVRNRMNIDNEQLQKVMISILKKDLHDRTLVLTDDFSSIMNNILCYCDLCMNHYLY